MAKYKKEVHKSCFDICLFYFLYFSDNTKLSSSFQPSYDDVGKAWEKDNGCNDTASEEAIEEDWIIVEGPRIGNADGEQHQQGSMLQNGNPQQQTRFNMPQQLEHQQSQQQVGGSNEAKVVEVFNAEVSGGSNDAKVDDVLDAGVLGGSNEAKVEIPIGANGKVDVEDSSNAEGNFNQTAYLLTKWSEQVLIECRMIILRFCNCRSYTYLLSQKR